MEEKNKEQHGCGGGGEINSGGGGSTEMVRSRWTPKPEQILILESIFNSGMVNPPKEETVRIRKLLEKFGAVGDANVFYWFQNRRSRSRRRQRQLQASMQAASSASSMAAPGDGQANMGYHQNYQQQPSGARIQYEGGSSCGGGMDFMGGAMNATLKPSPPYSYFLSGQSSEEESMFSLSSNPIVLSGGGSFQDETAGGGGVLLSSSSSSSTPSHIIMSSSSTATSEASTDFLYQTSETGGGGGGAPEGYITVFINGMATQVPRGPLDVRSMFGEVALLHSSGLSLPVNDYGFLLPGLHPGESYFLVSRQA